MSAMWGFASRFLSWIVALVLLVGVSAAAGRWLLTGPSLTARARQAYEKGDWSRAADLVRRRLKVNAGDMVALQLYARASIRLNRDELGNMIYKDRLGAERMQPEDYFLVGLTLCRVGRNDTAFQIWEKAARDGPDHPELLDHLTRLATSLERLDDAAAAAKRLTQHRESEAKGLLLLGEIQHLLENPRGAADGLQLGLKSDPFARGAPFDVAHYRKLLARSLLQLGLPIQAQKQLMTVSASTGTSDLDTDQETHWLLSRAYLQQNRAKDATAALARAGAYGAGARSTLEPGPYIGAARCAVCHSKISQTHQRTRHSRTFHHGAKLRELPLPNHPMIDPDDPEVTHTVRLDEEKIRVETRAGNRLFNMVVDYAFGTPERYVTMIGRDDERNYRAPRLSYYHSTIGSGWDRTSGDVSDHDPVENSRGELIDVRDGVVRCLYCHVTQARNFRDPRPETGQGPEAADSGIGCERCHGPGGNHLAAINNDFADRAIDGFGTATAGMINTQCGQCHIVGSRAEIARAPDDPKYVRSSAFTLTFSRCYAESGGGLSCLTCHDAHREAEHATSFYEKKCLSCHSPEPTSRTESVNNSGHMATQTVDRSNACPVNPTNDCINCHMPKVSVADLHASLTDHYIRVHGRRAPARGAKE
jgi:tetratricopeptide (TPR) repeat protein